MENKLLDNLAFKFDIDNSEVFMDTPILKDYIEGVKNCLEELELQVKELRATHSKIEGAVAMEVNEFAIANKNYLASIGLPVEFLEEYCYENQISIPWSRIFVIKSEENISVRGQLTSPHNFIYIFNEVIPIDEMYFLGVLTHELSHFDNPFTNILRIRIREDFEIEPTRIGWKITKLNESSQNLDSLGNFFEESVSYFRQLNVMIEYSKKQNGNNVIGNLDFTHLSDDYLSAFNSLSDLLPNFKDDIVSARRDLYLMRTTIRKIESKCKGLYPYLRALQIGEFHIGENMINQIIAMRFDGEINLRIKDGVLENLLK